MPTETEMFALFDACEQMYREHREQEHPETAEQAAASQQQIEQFAFLAHATKAAVIKLKDAFGALADYPISVQEAMEELSTAAAIVADDARDWAKEGNADFNPASA